MPSDFADLDDARRRIFQGLKERFDAVGFVVFDETFEPKPSQPRPGQDPHWGGYLVEFKIISRAEHEKHRHDLAALQRNAFVVSLGSKRRFKVDISKFEFCSVKRHCCMNERAVPPALSSRCPATTKLSDIPRRAIRLSTAHFNANSLNGVVERVGAG